MPSSRSTAVPNSALASQSQLGQDRRGVAHPPCWLLHWIAPVALLPVLALISDNPVHAIILHQLLDVLQRPRLSSRWMFVKKVSASVELQAVEFAAESEVKLPFDSASPEVLR